MLFRSFDPRHLKTLERWHEPASVARAVGHLRAAGIGRINLDLIFGIPGQRLEEWESDVRAALALGVRSFDSSAGGLGGCPYAPGARGNVDTAALLAMLRDDGYETGVDADALSRATSLIRQHLRAAAS